MKRKDATVVLAAGIVGAICLSRILCRVRAKSNTHRAQAVVAFRENKFSEVIQNLKQIHSLSLGDRQMMAEAYMRLGCFLEAKVVMDKIVEEEVTVEVVRRRYDAHTELGMHRNVLKDLIILSVLDRGKKGDEQRAENGGAEGASSKYETDLTSMLKAVSGLYALRRAPTSAPSPIVFRNFFDSLLFIENENCGGDPAVVYIRSGDFSSCWELVKEPSGDLQTLIKGCMEYVYGYYRDAVATLSRVKTEHAEAILFFVRAERRRHERETYLRCIQAKSFSSLLPASDLRPSEVPEHAISDDSTDPTVHYFLAKGYENLEEHEKSREHLEKSLALSRSYPALCYKIITLLRTSHHIQALQLLDEGALKWPQKMELNCIAIECLLQRKQENEALEWLCNMERTDAKDTRTHLFKYILGRALKKESVAHLHAAIEADPLYFRNYVYLANHTMGKGDSYDACKKALDHAHGFDETFIAQQLVLFVEAHNEAEEECPGLFQQDERKE